MPVSVQLYVDRIEGEGEMLFELVCGRDLEGVPLFFQLMTTFRRRC